MLEKVKEVLLFRHSQQTFTCLTLEKIVNYVQS